MQITCISSFTGDESEKLAVETEIMEKHLSLEVSGLNWPHSSKEPEAELFLLFLNKTVRGSSCCLNYKTTSTVGDKILKALCTLRALPAFREALGNGPSL